MQRVLIVDDNPQNIKVLANILKSLQVEIEYALSGKEAIGLLSENEFDLILMDVMMPQLDGYKTTEIIRLELKLINMPIIFVTAIDESAGIQKAFEVGGVDYITKPVKEYEVLARVSTHLRMKMANDLITNKTQALEDEIEKRTMELARTQEAIIVSLANLMEHRDNETGSHIIRTMTYMKLMANQLHSRLKYSGKCNPEEFHMLSKSAVLHDIGKVGIPDRILLKPGRLTPDEFEQMKLHTVYGYETLKTTMDMIGENCFLKIACEIAHYHHEKWDGTGYPKGLKGDEIPLPAQMMAIADVYDALTTKRVYKDAISHEEAVRIILSERGKHFSPDLVDVFAVLKNDFWRVAYEHADSKEGQTIIGIIENMST